MYLDFVDLDKLIKLEKQKIYKLKKAIRNRDIIIAIEIKNNQANLDNIDISFKELESANLFYNLLSLVKKLNDYEKLLMSVYIFRDENYNSLRYNPSNPFYQGEAIVKNLKKAIKHMTLMDDELINGEVNNEK